MGMTFLPGKHGPSVRYPGLVYRGDLRADLASLIGEGVRRLILLVEDAELARWGDPATVRTADALGLEVVRRPMPDGAPPRSVEEMDEIVELIRQGRSTGDVAVACMGGVGRTGTVCAGALIAAGLSADGAVAAVRRARHPEAVETAAQRAFLDEYAIHRLQGAAASAARER
ncbi:MAG: protein-tyrosine-phosphatase [Chloroflexota bacterium]|nr:protein-tyrosine-phosphatase [Chloroflexota bacterium]